MNDLYFNIYLPFHTGSKAGTRDTFSSSEGYLEEKCAMCGFEERRVLDYKMPLLLHFKDGNKKNYKLDNIELLYYNHYFLNVGDSRAVLGRKGTVIWESVPLSTDQNPEVQAERDVIEKAGGVVDTFKDEEGHPMGPLRIWVPGKNPPVPGLAMTRSIGDRLA